MAYLLDFENEKHEKGYEKFYPSRENIRKNIGKKICFVTYVDPHRGYFTVITFCGFVSVCPLHNASSYHKC
jgi:hypothetical protein